jgi:hypothetical protein
LTIRQVGDVFDGFESVAADGIVVKLFLKVLLILMLLRIVMLFLIVVFVLTALLVVTAVMLILIFVQIVTLVMLVMKVMIGLARPHLCISSGNGLRATEGIIMGWAGGQLLHTSQTILKYQTKLYHGAH